MGVLMGLFFMGTAWTWWRYQSAGMIVSSTGITNHSAFRPKTIRWEDVLSYHLSEKQSPMFGIVVGAKCKIRFWMTIGGVEELQEEITRRACKNSTHGWKARQHSA